MTTIEEFKEITQEFSDELFSVFKNKIDIAIEKAEERKLSPIYKYDFIYEVIEETYIELSIALGETKGNPFPRRVKHNLPELLEIRIVEYIDPIMMAAQDDIRKRFQELQITPTINEMIKKYEELNKIMGLDSIKENIEYFRNIEISNKKGKRKTLTTS